MEMNNVGSTLAGRSVIVMPGEYANVILDYDRSSSGALFKR